MKSIKPAKGPVTCKSNFPSSLQVYKTNNIFMFSKMNLLIAKSCSEIGRVNKPLHVNLKVHLHWRNFARDFALACTFSKENK